jgi:adenylylsulfate kinase-like enzyme
LRWWKVYDAEYNMIRTDAKYFWPLTVFLDAAQYTVSERDPRGLQDARLKLGMGGSQ